MTKQIENDADQIRKALDAVERRRKVMGVVLVAMLFFGVLMGYTMTQIRNNLRMEMMFGFIAVICFVGGLEGCLVIEIRRYTRAILKAIQLNSSTKSE